MEPENTTSTEQKEKKKELGAFWLRKSKNGNSFLSGSIKPDPQGEEIKVVVFKNSYKQEGSNQPDYRVYLDESSAQPGGQSMPKPQATTPKKNTTDSAPAVMEEDIPF